MKSIHCVILSTVLITTVACSDAPEGGGVPGRGGVAGAGGAVSGGGGVSGIRGVGFPAVADFAARGPFATTRLAEGPQCTTFRPDPLGEGGLRHPVIVWGNGTYSNPTIYAAVLTHWASHGFIAIAADTSNAGTGQEMQACVDFVLAENGKSGSVYQDKVDAAHVGASGHSQGGGGSIMLGTDARVTATAPLEPYVLGLGHQPSSQSMQHGPMFLMSGGSDTIAPPVQNQQPVFDNANVPVFWGTLAGADHVVSGIGGIGGFRGPATAWFRYHLMGDSSARAQFYGSPCALCTDAMWTVQRKNIN
ncbi:MAG TPA: alpha/beta hydrolase [Polyangia bacterium]|jgi:hypothetical protein|nr:alpha/beta hydrolase [Polyangia bacterium]